MIGNILEKLGRGQPLTPTEIQELIRWGNDTELNNMFTKGLQTGSSDIRVANLTTNGVIRTGRDVISGLACRLKRTTEQSMASSNNVQWDEEEYDDGNFFDGNTSTEEIRIPLTGIYNVTIGAYIIANAAAATTTYYLSTNKNGVSFYPTMGHELAAGKNFIEAVSDERSYTEGDTLTVKLSHGGGANARLITAYFTMRLIRS